MKTKSPIGYCVAGDSNVVDWYPGSDSRCCVAAAFYRVLFLGVVYALSGDRVVPKGPKRQKDKENASRPLGRTHAASNA